MFSKTMLRRARISPRLCLALIAAQAAFCALLFAAQFTSPTDVVPIGIVTAVISAAIVVWYFFFQREAGIFRLTLYSLLWLMFAVAIGTQIGVLVVATLKR